MSRARESAICPATTPYLYIQRAHGYVVYRFWILLYAWILHRPSICSNIYSDLCSRGRYWSLFYILALIIEGSISSHVGVGIVAAKAGPLYAYIGTL